MKNVAWVTGAGKGIGKEIAIELARKSWHVAVTSRTISDLNLLVEEASGQEGAVSVHPGDITDCSQMEDIINKIEVSVGPIELAVLNAGTYFPIGIDDFNVEKFGRQLEINVMGTVNCLAPILSRMKKRQSGYIVIVSSLSSYCGLPYASAYGASKAALTNMCESLKPELTRLGIGLSVVHPGFVKTPLTELNNFRMPFLIEARVAANKIIKGVENGQFEISFPKPLVLFMSLLRWLPYSIYFVITRRLLKK